MKVYKTKEDLKAAVDDYLGMKGRFRWSGPCTPCLSYHSPTGVMICMLSVRESKDGWRVNEDGVGFRVLTEDWL